MQLGDQEGHSGRWQHADPHDVRARAGQPGRDGGLEHLAAGPRVPADDGHRAVGGVVFGQHPCGACRHRQGQLRGQVVIGQTTHSVGAEQTCHACALQG